jgi:aryl-alcohol dehydrogenase-like predicted oxidoreductase
MKYRAFGKSTLVVSEICFGTWTIAGDSNNYRAYGPMDDNESIRALQVAHEKFGINFFDTAEWY